MANDTRFPIVKVVLEGETSQFNKQNLQRRSSTMRKAPSYVVIAALIALFGLSRKTLAASSDTLVVYANGPSIDQVINSDTTASGQQAHSVYKFVSLDTTYIFLSQITPRSSVTFLGVSVQVGGLTPFLKSQFVM